MNRERLFGHFCAAFCAVIWGSTFLVSKRLLEIWTPAQVMLLRFAIAWAVLWILCPKWRFRPREELYFLLMCVSGNTLYYLLENTALLHTYSSNVSILVSAAPILTVLLVRLLHREQRLPRRQLAGIWTAFAGVILVVLNGAFVLRLSPIGDLMSLGAACCWAFYGLFLERITDRFSGAMISRKMMFYGVVTTIPLILAEGEPFPLVPLTQAGNIIGLLFLGVVGCAVCYTAMTRACAALGIVMTNMYVYAIPFVTLAAGYLFMDEPITPMAVIGAVVIALGLMISAGTPLPGRRKQESAEHTEK